MQTEPITPGWRDAGERALTSEEVKTLCSLARQWRRRAILAGVCTPLAFFGWIVGMAAASSLVRETSGAVFMVAIFGPALVMAACYLWMRDAARRASGLREDLKHGAARCYEGTLEWSVGLTPLEERLLRKGLMRRDATQMQTLEVLPASNMVWLANGAVPEHRWFEAEPIWLAIPPDSAGHEEPTEADASSQTARSAAASEPVRWWSCLWAWIAVAFWWWLASSMVVRSVALPGPWPVRYLLGAGVAMAGTVAVVGVHEAGHLLAGRLAGMRFVWCRVGPFAFVRTAGGVRWAWTGLRFYASGLAMMAVEDERRFRWRDGWMTAGGPLASLALAVILFVASQRFWLPANDPSGGNEALRLFAIIAGVQALLSSIPAVDPASRLSTDAGLLRWLWSDPEGARFAAATSVLLARVLGGQRPGEWDPDLLSRSCRDPWGGTQAFGHLLVFYRHLDAGRPEAALNALETALSSRDDAGLHLEMAWYQGFYTHDARLARRHLDAAGTPKDDRDAKRAEAAVLLAEGDTAGARSLATSALKDLKWEPGAGLAAAKEEWLRRILAECDPQASVDRIEP